jgi:hypothetical protein
MGAWKMVHFADVERPEHVCPSKLERWKTFRGKKVMVRPATTNELGMSTIRGARSIGCKDKKFLVHPSFFSELGIPGNCTSFVVCRRMLEMD